MSAGAVLGMVGRPMVVGTGQRPLGWSIDLQPVQLVSTFRITPAPFNAVRKVRDEMVFLQSRCLVGVWEGGLMYTFQTSLWLPPSFPGSPSHSRVILVDWTVAWRALGSWSSWAICVATRSLPWMVVLTSRRTLRASSSSKVRFSMVQT
jgi:hypothetical protein